MWERAGGMGARSGGLPENVVWFCPSARIPYPGAIKRGKDANGLCGGCRLRRQHGTAIM